MGGGLGMTKFEWETICLQMAPVTDQLARIIEKHQLGTICIVITDDGAVSFSKITGVGSFGCSSIDHGPYQLSKDGEIKPYAHIKRKMSRQRPN